MAERTFIALGHRIALDERGEGERACLLLHGLAGDRALLCEVLDGRLAAAGLRRLHVDLPGHGASVANPEQASADALVEALRQLLVSLGGPAPLVVAQAYGGYLALGLLRDVPQIAGALLVGPVVEPDLGRRTRPARRVARRDPNLVFLADPAAADDGHERETFEEAAVVQSAAVLAGYRRLCMPASRAANRPFLDAVRARYAMSRPLVDALSRLEAPVAMVCGRDDHWVGFEDAARLARALPAASLHVLADAGPLLPLEQPARLGLLVDDWLARVRERAAPAAAT